ncbi:DAK2 domain-containing protein [Streptomyces cacaoi]|uniref:DhaL domain-containing protein n=1 Tax=Streptomyces cacaoi TaxID=1898 RepID=A0A4Y3QSN9_STRCI|nr:DAK2 domain-containing protein [Streptomyces cacaoi]NNG84004.1 DAK2 domain-containing protein [Streptomyces cacaoi]GEB48426.1 hypothetical protein SCA03_09770 [Streptomyces cacaoi]
MDDSGSFAEQWMRRFAASVSATEPELTALDQEAGDGDFGTNLDAGLKAALSALEPAPAGGTAAGGLDAAGATGGGGSPGTAGGSGDAGSTGGARDAGEAREAREARDAGDAGDDVPALRAVATAFLDEVGGTSGPLFGLLLQDLAQAAEEAGHRLTVPALARGARAGLAAIQRVGEAVPGDKTLVDGLAPACEALASAEESVGPANALAVAADAAWQGVRSTADLRARRGRASYVGERASGVPDPGAVGIGLLFASAGGTVTSLAPYLEASGSGGGPGGG